MNTNTVTTVDGLKTEWSQACHAVQRHAQKSTVPAPAQARLLSQVQHTWSDAFLCLTYHSPGSFLTHRKQSWESQEAGDLLEEAATSLTFALREHVGEGVGSPHGGTWSPEVDADWNLCTDYLESALADIGRAIDRFEQTRDISKSK